MLVRFNALVDFQICHCCWYECLSFPWSFVTDWKYLLHWLLMYIAHNRIFSRLIFMSWNCYYNFFFFFIICPLRICWLCLSLIETSQYFMLIFLQSTIKAWEVCSMISSSLWQDIKVIVFWWLAIYFKLLLWWIICSL